MRLIIVALWFLPGPLLIASGAYYDPSEATFNIGVGYLISTIWTGIMLYAIGKGMEDP